MSDLTKQLEEAIEAMRCYKCNEPTDRLILFTGGIEAYECIDCRQERVQKQVDEGLRPASDLEPENLPERRNPL